MVPSFGGQIIVFFSELVEFKCQQSKTLIDIVVKLSGYTGAFLLLCFNQLSGHAGEFLLHLLAVSNILGKDENSPRSAVEGHPRTSHPVNPHSAAACAIPPVFLGSQGFALKSTAVNLFPASGKVGKKLVMRTSGYLRTVNSVISTPAVTRLQITHLTVEHRHSRWYVLDEDFQQFLP